jgi:hypothetical protein
VRELHAQRLLGLAAGYEDLNDHNLLRLDPLFAVAVGKEDPLGSGRAAQDQGKALASAPTLNRLELGNNKNARCHKISADHQAIEDTFCARACAACPKRAPKSSSTWTPPTTRCTVIRKDVSFTASTVATVTCHSLALSVRYRSRAQLRTSEGGAAGGAVDALKKIVSAVRKRGPKAQIIVRADSSFCREELMAWCETQEPVVYYCLGLAHNSRLRELIEQKFARVRESAMLCGGVARGFSEFQYQTLKSWTV